MTADTDTMPALPEPFMPLLPNARDLWQAQLRAYARQCVEQERERCAKLVEKKAAKEWIGVDEMADAIRSQKNLKE